MLDGGGGGGSSSSINIIEMTTNLSSGLGLVVGESEDVGSLPFILFHH